MEKAASRYRTGFEEAAIALCRLDEGEDEVATFRRRKKRRSRRRVNLNRRDGSGDTPLHLAARTGQAGVVRAILGAEAALTISSTNAGGLTPLELAADDEVAGLIIRDRRFRPTENLTLKTGKTLLMRLCSVETEDGLIGVAFQQDLYSKVDALFINKIDPADCENEMLTANQFGNLYIVWLLLKAGPSSVDLSKIDFFRALEEGAEHDLNMQYDQENALHIFARSGFTRAIHYIMTCCNTGSVRDALDLPANLYGSCCRNKSGNHPPMEAAKHNKADALVLLLQPMLQLAMQTNHEAEKNLDYFLHGKNGSGQNLLLLVSHHQKNLFLPHSMTMHLELQCHGNRHEEIQVRSLLTISRTTRTVYHVYMI